MLCLSVSAIMHLFCLIRSRRRGKCDWAHNAKLPWIWVVSHFRPFETVDLDEIWRNHVHFGLNSKQLAIPPIDSANVHKRRTPVGHWADSLANGPENLNLSLINRRMVRLGNLLQSPLLRARNRVNYTKGLKLLHLQSPGIFKFDAFYRRIRSGNPQPAPSTSNSAMC